MRQRGKVHSPGADAPAPRGAGADAGTVTKERTDTRSLSHTTHASSMGKRSRRRRTAAPAPPEAPTPCPAPTIQLKDSVQERCKGKVGLELAREVVDAGLEQIGGTRKTVGSALRNHYSGIKESHVMRMLELASKFPFPGVVNENSLVVPREVLPLSVGFVVRKERFNQRGEWLVDDLSFETLGQACTRLMKSAIVTSPEGATAILESVEDGLRRFAHMQWLFAIGMTSTPSNYAIINMFLHNLIPAGLARVRIGRSSTDGTGVYATRQIEEGELITAYPCDVVGVNCGNGQMRVFRRNGEALTRTEGAMYAHYFAVIEGSDVKIAGSPDNATPAACAHLINDGETLDASDFGQEDLLRYTQQSFAKQNCQFVNFAGVCLVAVATRRIKAGAEVLTCYGAEHFASANRGIL